MEPLHDWINIGNPGPAPEFPFAPDQSLREFFKSMESGFVVPTDWHITQSDARKLELGHQSHDMDDKWHIYTQDGTTHFHRSWTGEEIYQFTTELEESGIAIASFTVAKYRWRLSRKDKANDRANLLQVMNAVLDIYPIHS